MSASETGGTGSRTTRSARRRSLGLTLIFATSAIWTISSFLSAFLVSAHDDRKAAVHPFLLTYLATSLFSLFIPMLWVKKKLGDMLHGTPMSNGPCRQGAHRSEHAGSLRSSFDGIETTVHSMDPIAARKMALHAAAWCVPLWFTAQWTFNVSLSLTSVTSNTILSSTSSLFTFFLSILLLGEVFSSRKLAAIVACIAGVALVTLSDSKSTASASSIQGDMMALLAAAVYAGYTVVMRKCMPGEEAEKHVALFFGYVGIISTVALAPVVLLCSSIGVFSFSSIPQGAYAIIVLEGLLDYVLSDYLWALAVMLLGPTVATAGLSVQIPMAAVADVLLGNATWTHSAQTFLFTLGGTVLILVGFFYINLMGSQGAMTTETAEVDSSNEEENNEKLEEASLLSDQPGISRGEEINVARGSTEKAHRQLK